MYNGFEVFFLFLENADCILVRHYSANRKTVVLIDGGGTQDAPVVRRFLSAQGESRLNHLVCSHPHLDHGGGLVELIKDRTLLIDKAWVHAGDLLVDRINASKYSAYSNLLKRVQAAKDTQRELIAALLSRKTPIEEPFAFNWVGPLQIVSPTPAF